MKIDTENDGVEMIEITVGQARNAPTEEWPGFDEAVDNAQAYAFGGNGDAYLIIKIRG